MSLSLLFWDAFSELSKNNTGYTDEPSKLSDTDTSAVETEEPARVKTYSEIVYEEAVANYDLLWGQLCEKSTLRSSEIDSLRAAFDKLSNAVKRLNESELYEAAGSSLVNSDLRDRMLLAIGLLEMELVSANSEYDEVMSLISENGGAITEEQKDRLSKAVSDAKSAALAG